MQPKKLNRDEVLEGFKSGFKDDILDVFLKSPKRVYVEIKPSSIRRLTEHFIRTLGARFNIASGLDARDHMEILYHFTIEDANCIFSLRVKLPKNKLEIDSITPIFEGANWIEREITELLGIRFKGHPDMRKLLLPDEWPEGVYPLRRDYREWDKGAIRDRGV